MTTPVTVSMNDAGPETIVQVHEIGFEDTTLTVDIYTRNPSNARQTLEDLRAAIDALLKEWKTAKIYGPATDATGQPYFLHSGGKWPLHILRSPAD